MKGPLKIKSRQLACDKVVCCGSNIQQETDLKQETGFAFSEDSDFYFL